MKYFLIGLLLAIFPSQLLAQAGHAAKQKMIKSQRVIIGKLENSQPGATVTIKGTRVGVATDAEGRFELKIPDSVSMKKITLVYSNVGFENEELLLKEADFSEVLSADFPEYRNKASNKQFYIAYSLSIPSFNWPPPPPSTQNVMDRDLLAGVATLGDANNKLLKGLKNLGYTENRYYSIPDGFCLVTRLERIKLDAPESYDLPDRWDVNVKIRINGLSEYLYYLANAKVGRFRVIVFAFTDSLITTPGKSINRDDAMAWLKNGATTLPPEIARKAFGQDYNCTVLIYEFEKKENTAPIFIPNSHFPADQHLNKIYTFLKSEN